MDIAQHLLFKYHAFQRVEANSCSLQQASVSLGLSYRQTLRWWKKYQTCAGDLVPFTDSQHRRGGHNRLQADLIQSILDNKKQYPHRSVQHIADSVSEEVAHVCASTVYRILQNADLLGTNEEKRMRVYKRFEASAFGERLQMDTTSGAWMRGYRLIYLIAVIDDYSRMLVGWRWVDSDSAWNNMGVLRCIYEKYGLPQTLYTDNASMFKTIRHDKSIYQKHRQEGYETEIQRCMKELGVTMFSHKPYEPQSKGKVERFFRFMQERFVREHTATNLTQMNEQFDVWARWYNSKHVNRTTGCKPKDRSTPSVFTPISHKRKLESAFSFKTTRKVDKCNAIQFEGESYRLKGNTSFYNTVIDLESTPSEIRLYKHGVLLARINRESPT
ncbi:MAG: DDE-type integrase/transposase/recombinase [Candidatus Uhrbacteria bacterium]|nr:DDE-type integrase/transposase/recombinase [Candidatus Uhrbacteria bacterium]